MQREAGVYADAARLLWDLPPERLAALASGDSQAAQSVRDAAHMALGVKREFLAPEEFGSEHAALDRLAANLAMLPDFSLQEIALACGHGPIRRVSPSPAIALEPTSPGRRRVLRVALVSMVVLLALEALAQAGVPVPSPIGAVVDGVGGGSTSMGGDDASGGPLDFADPRQSGEGLLPPPAAGFAKEPTTIRVTKPKNDNHARGRSLHFAQGRTGNQKQKKDKSKPESAERPTHRGRSDVIDTEGRAIAGTTNRAARAHEAHGDKVDRGRGPK